ncbi:MAG TPA: FAD-dependent oxidoreductase, partial [Hyphomicrobiales bacterium]|nr:FAD-dependent oxidoreductase [Hyphomicrobiales bacterium]
MQTIEVLVIGNGMVGHYYADKLSTMGDHFKITILGAETRPAYDRVHLSELFADKKPADLALATTQDYADRGIDAHFGEEALRIDRDAQVVHTSKGRRFRYDKLVLATGSYPFVPPIPGAEQPACLTYRTIDDLGHIRAEARTARSAVVIGGGLLGLECANALRNLKLQTHVVEFAPGIMGVQLDTRGSQFLQRMIEALGVRVHTGKATQKIVPGRDSRLSLQFADAGSLDTDLVVFSAGIRPADSLAREAGLEVGPRGGIVIDYHCRTSDSNIYAIGECALFGGRIFGLVAPGYRMADAALSQLTDTKVPFQGADMSTKLKLLGVEVGSIGDAHGTAEGSVSYQYANEKKAVYKRLNVSADGKRLLGAVLVGDTADYDMLLQYALNGLELPADPESLILPTAGAKPLLSAGALPPTATLCSCHNVTKAGVTAAMDGGALTLAAVKHETKASTGCGGCAALLKSVVDSELKARGVAVTNHLCAHFAHSRQ